MTSTSHGVLLATQLALVLVGGCNRGQPDRCFPVPAGEGVVARGDHARGGDLQGGGRGSQLNSDALQGNGRGSNFNGDALQGTGRGSNLNGDALQGTGRGSNFNGSELQGGGRGSNINGSELQGGGRGSNFNGTELQGDGRGSNMNGSELQGSGRGSNFNGSELQGGGRGSSLNGSGLQGGGRGSNLQGRELQGSYRGLADLNGVRLTLARDPGAVVGLAGRELVAPGFGDTAALRGIALTATTAEGRQFAVEIAAVTLDGQTPRIELRAGGEPVCASGAAGLFVAGRWDATGAHVAEAGLVTYACGTGVIAKCVDWGYAPWQTDATVHATCTRMARADYCGDGHAWTLDGTVIDVFDRLGIKAPVVDDGLRFEAGWGPNGAVCVARTRYDVRNADGAAIEPRCFAALPTCADLDEAVASGAVLANSTYLPTIAACH